MYKYIIAISLLFSSCANFTVNSTMCDNLGTGSDRSMQSTPSECRNYDEKEADKAFKKVVEDKKVSDEDIKFDKEENE